MQEVTAFFCSFFILFFKAVQYLFRDLEIASLYLGKTTAAARTTLSIRTNVWRIFV